jgi:signal transduction histidine kinase
MTPFLDEIQIALAVAPAVGAIAIRGLWTRRQASSELREREERARIARQEAMTAMQQALSAARAAQKSREEFLARMSHELRTPLNAVIGFSRVLEKNRAGNQRPEDIELLGRVRAGGEHLLRLVEDVLDQSRIERGQLELAIEQTDVGQIVERVAASYASTAAARGIRLRTVVPAEPSSRAVRLDSARFEQVLENLVDNAIKFTVSGAVLVEVITEESGHPGAIVVADSGIGIPSDKMERIFEPFEQVDSSTRRSHGGAGLGLPLARELCRAMGCDLSVQSQLGAGSKFTVRLPTAA